MGMQQTSDRVAQKHGLLAFKVLDTVMDVLESPASRAKSDLSRQFRPTHPKARQEFCDRVTPNMMYASHISATFFLIFEP